MTLFIIIIMSILAGAEIDLIVPSFPNLQEKFGLTPYMVELTLGVNLIAHGLSAIIIGTLGDKFGKRSIILYSLVIFILGTIICVGANNFGYILIGRALQGIGISGPAILPFIIVTDLYEFKMQQKIMSILNGLITIAIAPMVGSFINLYFGWRGNFALLLVLSIITFGLVILYLPKVEGDITTDVSIKEYWSIIRSKIFGLYIFCICFLVVGYWVFVALAPILYIRDLGVSLKGFGFYQGILVISYAIISLLHYKIVKILGEKNCFIVGIMLFVLFIIFSIIIMINNIKSPLIITAVVNLYIVGCTPITNILYPIMLASTKTAKARLGASITTFKLLLFFVNIQMVSYIYDGRYLYIGIAICLNLVVALFLLFKLFKNHAIIITS